MNTPGNKANRPGRVLTWLGLALGGVWTAQAGGTEGEVEPNDTSTQTSAADPAPAVKQVAAGTADLLRPPEPEVRVFPTWLAESIKRRTALFYFSPTCPHCQDVIPEINAIIDEGLMDWLGVASSLSTELELQSFKMDYSPGFKIVLDDEDRTFSRAVGARSTPSVYVVEPLESDAKDTAPGELILVEEYPPWPRGIGGIFRIRQHLDDPFRDFDRYVGMRTCMGCHSHEAQSWALTHHAVAYRTLYMRDRAQDLQCVGCHVTGIDQPGGFVVGDHGSVQRDVTCEACHGPGGPHNVTAEPTDPKVTCAGCHDAEHSVAFTVDKGLPHIDHFSSLGMSKDEMRDRMMALVDGEAPRPLLAFPEGPTTGSRACRSCHRSEYKNWKRSPHFGAMSHLGIEDQGQVDCVRCHATAPAYGGAEITDAGRYRTDESVGCEACHGAGGAHIASPAKDNIVGLGESCPECVIEAICTSCHTPKWDPSWELESRLQAAHH